MKVAVVGAGVLGSRFGGRRAAAGPGGVRFTAAGQTFIGEPNGVLSQRLQGLAQVLTEAGLPTEATDRLWEMVWGKLVINAAMNATCALTGASGEAVLASPAAY